MCLWHLLPIRTVFTLLVRVRYRLQLLLKLYFYVWWGLFCQELCLISVLILILDLIHSENFIIDLIPLFRHLYLLQIFLAPSETTIAVIVAPIIIIMMSRDSAVMNDGRRWSLAMMRLSMKRPTCSSIHHCGLGFTHFPYW